MTPQTKNIASISLLILAAAFSRLIPHWPNFTPIIGMALFGGAVLGSGWRSYFVPIAAMFVSDVVLGLVLGWEFAYHSTQWMVYSSLIVVAFIGTLFTKRTGRVTISQGFKTSFVGGTVAGILFFLTTNFAVWMSGGFYPHTFDGLVQCYVAGLAFYRDGGNFFVNGTASTWITSSTLFVVYFVARKSTNVSVLVPFSNKS